jgi:hypothetical protein
MRLRNGKPSHPLYGTWKAMHARCRDESNQHYGGKGIQVCERWFDFDQFVADMGERPSAGHSLDRKLGTRGYGPDNCRWATRRQQRQNQPGRGVFQQRRAFGV